MPLYNPPRTAIFDAAAAVATDITTTSVVDVIATDMSITPPQGMYLAQFSADMEVTLLGGSVAVSLYVDGVQVANTTRTFLQAALGGVVGRFTLECAAIVSVDGSQSIDVRWHTSALSTATMGASRRLDLTATF